MRWIRLDLSWSHSEWLSVLSAESRLAWVELLCYVKGFGTDGRARTMTPDRFARMIYVGEESVRQMLRAAEIHGSLAIIDNDWVIVKWSKYQGDETAAERMRRYRENRKARSVESAGDDPVTDVTRNARNVTDVTGTETETETETSKKHSKKNACEAPFISESVAEVISYLNEKAGRKFDPAGGNCNQLRARVRDAGAKCATQFVADAKRVVDLKVGEWGDDAKMSKFLRPETLFNSEKWPTYLEASSRASNGRHLMTREDIDRAAAELR